MDSKPKISVITPVHDMENGAFFLERLTKSLKEQTYTNYEHIITKEGAMAQNTNAGIRKATGDIIKILYLDDYLASPGALQRVAEACTKGWVVSGCIHDNGELFNPHLPSYTYDIITGNNRIGSPSVLAFENNNPLFFDETMTWMLDCDYYKRLYDRYGLPKVIPRYDVAIGVGNHQTTHLLSDTIKQKEAAYMKQKYD